MYLDKFSNYGHQLLAPKRQVHAVLLKDTWVYLKSNELRSNGHPVGQTLPAYTVTLDYFCVVV